MTMSELQSSKSSPPCCHFPLFVLLHGSVKGVGHGDTCPTSPRNLAGLSNLSPTGYGPRGKPHFDAKSFLDANC